MFKVMVLLSGGLDSATVLASYRGHIRAAVAFDYGQPHGIELERAREIAALEDVPLDVLRVPTMPKVDEVVFAGRNAVLISMAASFALSKGFFNVAIGCNYSDWERFPDCRPDFVKAMASALKGGYDVNLWAPLLRMSKTQVVELAKELSVPIERTWSCYAPTDRREPCRKCAACIVREKAILATEPCPSK